MLYFVLSILVLITQNCDGFFRFDYQHLLAPNIKLKFDVSVTTHWITQPLDHFNLSDTRTWMMRYFENLQFFTPGGPIILFIGGESDASPIWLNYGLMADFGKEVGGALYMSEHRFYGKSVPYNDLSVSNLLYLSSRQALADLKNLLEYLKTYAIFKTSKVILFGGSYAGNLAAWMRLLYPQVVDAAHSSSGPVLAKTNFYEYLQVVGSDLTKYGAQNCYTAVHNQFQIYANLLKTPKGIQHLKIKENICPHVDMNIRENQYILFSSKISKYAKLVQYGDPATLYNKCLVVLGLSDVSNDSNYNVWNERSQCNDYDFNAFVSYLRSAKNDKAWFYQTCTEFGYLQTTSAYNQPFPHYLPVDFYVKICKGTFGPQFDLQRVENGVQMTNSYYGGRTPRVEKVIFVNGDMDPWHTLGVLNDLSYDAPARVITTGSHCSELTEYANDFSQRTAIVQFAKQKLKEWTGLI